MMILIHFQILIWWCDDDNFNVSDIKVVLLWYWMLERKYRPLFIVYEVKMMRFIAFVGVHRRRLTCLVQILPVMFTIIYLMSWMYGDRCYNCNSTAIETHIKLYHWPFISLHISFDIFYCCIGPKIARLCYVTRSIGFIRENCT